MEFVKITPFGRDLTSFSSFLQGIIQINLSSTLAASVGFAPLSIAQASLTLLSLIVKITPFGRDFYFARYNLSKLSSTSLIVKIGGNRHFEGKKFGGNKKKM